MLPWWTAFLNCACNTSTMHHERTAIGPPRVIRARTDANTWTLVNDVTYAARIAAASIAWPRNLPRRDALEVVHALAASVRYRADQNDQTIKLPHVLLNSGVGDCKSTSILCASLLHAAGVPNVRLKFLQYEEGPTWWEHVYCVANGTPVDPLLPLGKEFPYFRAITTPIP